MSWLKLSAAIGALAAQITTTMAADMPRTLPPPYMPRPFVERTRTFDLNSGWYLRGDLGYAWGRIDSAQSPSPATSPNNSTLGNGPFGGVGVGIKTKWLRTDVTFDYQAPLKYEGTIATQGDVSAKVSAWTILLNGYIDLGTWYRMTPYIGAGAGGALVHTSDYANAVVPPSQPGLTSNQWNFAYAAMAGVGVAISSNVVLDVGYRYLNLGDAKGGSDSFSPMTFKNLAAHEARVGVRWSFDDLPVTR